MKRLLIWVLALLLLLTGCNRKDPAQNPETTDTTPPESTGLYMPESDVELSTNGAVRAYQLDFTGKLRLTSMGNKLLLQSKAELSVLMGEYAEVTATMLTGGNTIDRLADISAVGIARLDQKTNQVVIRNPQLLEVQRVEIPKDCQETPLVSLLTGELYYVSGTEIRAMNLETGISRLVKTQNYPSQILTGCWFEGKVLSCAVTDEAGNTRTIYISTETGRTLSEDQSICEMQTSQDRYFIRRMEGQSEQSIFGTLTGTAQLFYPPAYAVSAVQFSAEPVPEINGAVQYGESAEGTYLVFCDFTTGKTGGQVFLPGIFQPTDICSDGTHLWFLAKDGKGSRQTLYRWDVKASTEARPVSCTGPLYTAQNPDTEGLALCGERIETMNKAYGVKISIWQDVLEYAGDLNVIAEHQTGTIDEMLNNIEPIISQFPEKFLQKTVEGGWIRICLVRALPDGESWKQTWEGGDCCIFLTPEADIQTALLQGIGYGVDTHVLGNSRDFDTWNALNPTGFVYTGDSEAEINASFLEGNSRYFVDAASMTYPHVDRCNIFHQAMLPDNVKMFVSSAMQKKLLRLCEGIREAYRLEKQEDTYPWEQYLTTSLAFVPEE